MNEDIDFNKALYGDHDVVELTPQYVLAREPETDVTIVVDGPGEFESRLKCTECGYEVEGYAPELRFQSNPNCPPDKWGGSE